MAINQLLKEHLKPFYPSFYLILFLTIIGILIQLATPWPFQILIDHILGQNPLPDNSPLEPIFAYLNTPFMAGMFIVVLYLIVNLLANFSDAIQTFVSNRIMRRVIHSFSEKVFAQAQVFDLGFYRTKEVGDYLYRISYDSSAIGSFIEFGILPLITSTLYLILAAIILFSINTTLTWVTLLSLPLLVLSLYRLNHHITNANELSESRNSNLYSFIQQNLSQLKIIQAYRQERDQIGHYSQKLNATLEADFKVNNLNTLLSFIIGIIITFTYTLIIGFGVHLVFSGLLTSGLLIIYIFYLDHLTQPTLRIVDAITTIREEYVRLKRLGEFFEPKAQIEDSGSVDQITQTNIQFVNITFKDNTGKPILDKINCSIPSGKITAIIGMSGSGKSTLTSLVMRLIDEPSDGAIMIGDYHTRDYKLDTLRKNIALVPQEIELFNDSIYDLITFGNHKADFQAVRRAAQLAVAEDFILKHPGGYQFKVGERGENLSGGQRQRISLARAYLKKAPIMIIDEIFAFQDPKTKQAMLENLRGFAYNRTVIMVTNTFDVIRPTDHVILIHQGHIYYQGPYANLVQSDALPKLLNQSESKEVT